MSEAIAQARAALEAEYAQACAQRDAVNAQIAPLRQQLEQVNTDAEALRVQAQDLADKIDALRGGGSTWLALKRRIGKLAEALMATRAGG